MEAIISSQTMKVSAISILFYLGTDSVIGTDRYFIFVMFKVIAVIFRRIAVIFRVIAEFGC